MTPAMATLGDAETGAPQDPAVILAWFFGSTPCAWPRLAPRTSLESFFGLVELEFT